MATRTFDRILECGCMISSDAGGCVMDCFSGYGDDEDAKLLCEKSWNEWQKTDDYQLHLKECEERNE